MGDVKISFEGKKNSQASLNSDGTDRMKVGG